MKKQIFDNQLVEQLLIEYKESRDCHVYQRICTESLDLMDSIIRSHNFYKQVPFHEIRNHLFTQFPKWIERWGPEHGKAYSYWTSCIKHGCISFVSKDANLRKKYMFTDIALDAVGHEEDVTYSHYHLSSEDMTYLTGEIHNILSRWKEPIIREALRYSLTAVIQNRADRRQELIKSLVWGYGISSDTSKFLLDWSLGAVRAALIEHYDSPLGESDMLRLAEKYSFIPDMINLIGAKNTKKMLVVFSGMTIRIPTTTHLRRSMAACEVYNSGDITPTNINRIGKRFGVTPAKMQETFETVSANMQAGLLEDSPLFEEKVDDDTLDAPDRGVPYYVAEFGGSEDESYG